VPSPDSDALSEPGHAKERRARRCYEIDIPILNHACHGSTRNDSHTAFSIRIATLRGLCRTTGWIYRNASWAVPHHRVDISQRFVGCAAPQGGYIATLRGLCRTTGWVNRWRINRRQHHHRTVDTATGRGATRANLAAHPSPTHPPPTRMRREPLYTAAHSHVLRSAWQPIRVTGASRPSESHVLRSAWQPIRVTGASRPSESHVLRSAWQPIRVTGASRPPSRGPLR
jgi:hypothetical protein